MDERAGDTANWKLQSWPFVLFFRQELFLESRNQKENSACNELKLDTIWWGINEKNNKRWGGESNKENGSFFTRRGSFLKTEFNYSPFHTWFTPGSSALSIEAKHFCYTLWGKIKADANGPEFGGLREGRKYMTLRTAILFPSVQMGSEEFIQSDIDGAHIDEANYW